MRRAASTSVFVLVLLAGCSSETPDPTPTTAMGGSDTCTDRSRPTFESPTEFSAANAYAHLLLIVCDFDASPPSERPRVPGTPEREAAAAYLLETLQAAAWTARVEGFAGAEYQALDPGSVAPYLEAPYCDEPKRQRVTGLQFANVLAELGGGPDLYLLLAHYDSKQFATRETNPANQTKPVLGANDGAGGVALLLELARVLALDPPSANVRILLVDGEDGFEDCHPVAGSLFHAWSLSETERNSIRGVLLLDMVGDPNAQFCFAGTATALRDQLKASAEARGVSKIANAGTCSILDDHTPFADRGIPALDLIDYGRGVFPPYWHTTHDTPEKLTPAMLGSVGVVVVDSVRNLTA